MKPIFLAEPWLPEDCAIAVKEQVQSTMIGPGEKSRVFGSELAAMAGRKYAVLTVSGTMALTVAAKVLGGGPNDEVILPAYGVFSVPAAIAQLGCRLKFVDVDCRTGCMDATKLANAISDKTKVVLYVDFAGDCGNNLKEIQKICKSANVPLLEDSAWSVGRVSGQFVGGATGDISIFSFSVAKVITTGQGGALLTDDKRLYEKAMAYTDLGDLDWRATNFVRSVGGNFRLSDLAASLGVSQIKQISERYERRNSVFNRLFDRLGDFVLGSEDGAVPMQTIMFCEDPDRFVRFLREHNIFATRQYRPYYHCPPYSEFGHASEFPASEFWFENSVFLPAGIAMTCDDADRIIDRIEEFDGLFYRTQDWQKYRIRGER